MRHGECDRLASVARPRDHRDVRLDLEQRYECAQHERLVFRDEDTNHGVSTPSVMHTRVPELTPVPTTS
jgi:hypothetical protein